MMLNIAQELYYAVVAILIETTIGGFGPQGLSPK